MEQINQEIVEASLLLSYNGKAFDWAVLQERFAYYGLRLDHLPIHIDLQGGGPRVLLSLPGERESRFTRPNRQPQPSGCRDPRFTP